MAAALSAGRPLVLIGFMGAGKSTVARALAARCGRPLVDADEEIERRSGRSVATLFTERGEGVFRQLEADVLARALRRDDAPIVAAGGGAVLAEASRRLLHEKAWCCWLDVTAATALERHAHEPGKRPLATGERAVRSLHAERSPLYSAAADAILDAAAPVDELAAALALGVWTRSGALGRLSGEVGDRRCVVIADGAVASRLGKHPGALVSIEGGEPAKSVSSVAALWKELAAERLERGDVVVCIGGGTITDLGGFAAATFRRGLAWLAVPSTLVGQVDAAIGGKTGIDVAAKNDVGSFWPPEAVLSDTALLETLPAREWSSGLAECVKTALLAGGQLWELVRAFGEETETSDLVRRCAGYKALVVAGDPTEQGRRAVLNLGHTIGHGVEAASRYRLSHGEAVAIGLAAALRLSRQLCGLDASIVGEVEHLLARLGLPVRAIGIEPGDVVAAMAHDKKRQRGQHRFVLLEGVGQPVHGRPVPDRLVAEAVQSATA